MRNLKFLAAFALLCVLVYAVGPANAGVANPPNIPLPVNPAGWCTATALVPGTVRTTQIGNCPAPPPSSCPAGRIASTVLSLRYDGAGRKLMDVTQADNIFGYNNWTDARLPFPWKQNYTLFWSFPRTPGAYVAAQFTVPAGVPQVQWGRMQNLETIPGPGTDWAISRQCGDFSPQAQYCAASNVITGRAYGNYKLPGAPVVAGCSLRAGETYYLMFRLHNPAAGGLNCNASTCQFGVQNNHNP